MVHFKTITLFLFMMLFSCSDKRTDVINLLSNHFDETAVFYKYESLNNYLYAKQKSEDYPYLERSFDSINSIRNVLDDFFTTYPNLKKEDKLNAILKTRKEINNLSKLKVKFIDINLLMKINDDILDKGINADFSKAYYNITSDYRLKHCNVIQ